LHSSHDDVTNDLSSVPRIRSTHLSLLLESVGEAAHVGLEVALVAEELDVGTVDLNAALLALGNVLLAAEGSEAPVLGDDDLLATGELSK
jgi:hypothetical protein